MSEGRHATYAHGSDDSADPGSAGRADGLSGRGVGSPDREPHTEHRFSRLCPETDVPTVPVDDAPGDVEPQASTFTHPLVV